MPRPKNKINIIMSIPAPIDITNVLLLVLAGFPIDTMVGFLDFYWVVLPLKYHEFIITNNTISATLYL